MYIYCNFTNFTLYQKIFLLNENGDNVFIADSASDIDSLAKTITSACDKFKVQNVKLIMPKDDFALTLVEEICTIGNTVYNNKNINVEVI